MVQAVEEKIKVLGWFDQTLNLKNLIWQGRNYEIKKLGYHHTVRKGRDLFHVFSVASDAMFFKLVLNSQNLTFKVMEVADGEVC